MAKKLDEIKDELESKIRVRDETVIDLNKKQKEIENLMEEYMEKNPEYVKVECLTCGGQGYIQTDEGKKRVCMNPQFPMLSCSGKGYNWLKKYTTKPKKEE